MCIKDVNVKDTYILCWHAHHPASTTSHDREQKKNVNTQWIKNLLIFIINNVLGQGISYKIKVLGVLKKRIKSTFPGDPASELLIYCRLG